MKAPKVHAPRCPDCGRECLPVPSGAGFVCIVSSHGGIRKGEEEAPRLDFGPALPLEDPHVLGRFEVDGQPWTIRIP